MDKRSDYIFTHATEIAEGREREFRRLRAEVLRETLDPLARILPALRRLCTAGLRAARGLRAG
jgi:hypothetical protein